MWWAILHGRRLQFYSVPDPFDFGPYNFALIGYIISANRIGLAMTTTANTH